MRGVVLFGLEVLVLVFWFFEIGFFSVMLSPSILSVDQASLELKRSACLSLGLKACMSKRSSTWPFLMASEVISSNAPSWLHHETQNVSIFGYLHLFFLRKGPST